MGRVGLEVALGQESAAVSLAGDRGVWGTVSTFVQLLFFLTGKCEQNFFPWLCLTACGIFVLDQGRGWGLCPLQWKCGVLSSGPPGEGSALCFNHLLLAFLLTGSVME